MLMGPYSEYIQVLRHTGDGATQRQPNRSTPGSERGGGGAKGRTDVSEVPLMFLRIDLERHFERVWFWLSLLEYQDNDSLHLDGSYIIYKHIF